MFVRSCSLCGCANKVVAAYFVQLYNTLKTNDVQQPPAMWLTFEQTDRALDAQALSVPLYSQLGPRPLSKSDTDFKKDHYQLYCSAGSLNSDLT